MNKHGDDNDDDGMLAFYKLNINRNRRLVIQAMKMLSIHDLYILLLSHGKNKQHSSITGVTYLLSIENEGWNYNQFDL